MVEMASSLQKVLPPGVLPRAPSPNSASPNPGIRATVTQFIPASPDHSMEEVGQQTSALDPIAASSFASTSASASALGSGPGSGSRHGRAVSLAMPETTASMVGGPLSPQLRRSTSSAKRSRPQSMILPSTSAGAGSRRGIAHSSKVLGIDKNAQEAMALSRLKNGKVDVSFEASLDMASGGSVTSTPATLSSTGRGKGKSKTTPKLDARGNRRIDGNPFDDPDAGAMLFDVDLEASHDQAARSPSSSRRIKLLPSFVNFSGAGPSKATPKSPGLANEEDRKKSKGLGITDFEAGPGLASPETGSNTPAQHRRATSTGSDTTFKPNLTNRDRADEDDNMIDDGDSDNVSLLRGATSEARPGYFAPGEYSFGYNSLDDSGDVYGSHAGGAGVGFEPVTYQEHLWMAVSAAFVIVLVVVAVLISVDVIDWPGDGIGNK
ncbi:hypothetical protein BCV70DRAFT_64858 [Testicularia cyperi]|uniref:Uncharacterized protein n=1 Tax=Testicularia cyperi TaxID=1882483 RepID=A0A317XI38_9BASI|nr:hypothetical protein BCV70DRAFT_64858 [Testicularia cyperi]